MLRPNYSTVRLTLLSPSNAPGSRASSAAWIDKQGTLWLFGGVRFDFPPGTNEFNDLWRYAP